MTKAHLKTRTASTSSVSATEVATSALTHAELDSNLINLRDSTWGIADDSSTVLQVSDDKTITIAGGSNITTSLSGDTLTITGADQAGSITALNNQAANRLTTIGATTTELDGEANLTFDGSTLAITGNMTASTTIGATTDITAGGSITAGTSIGNDAVSIDDNKITATRSNDNLFISANGTGAIHIAGDDSNIFNSTLYSNVAGTANRGNTIIATVESVDAGSIADRTYNSIIAHNTTLTGSGTDADFRPRAIHANSNVDLAGFDYTNASSSRGPVAIGAWGQVENSGAGASTLATLRGIDAGAYIQDYSNHNQDITIDNAYGVRTTNGVENNGTAALTMTNVYDYYGSAYTDNQSSGSATITNHYAFYTPGTGGTNNYAFYSASDTAESRLGTIERYRETINALTSSSTITVDCGLAPVHTITLGTNTEFNISNLGTGQTATIIITQDGTGSRTATFGTDGSTAVKFAGGTPTLSTAASSIDVITIFNDGTNYLGNIAQAYA
jgi:hypothetical protein